MIDPSSDMSPLYLQALLTSTGAIGTVVIHLHFEKLAQPPVVAGVSFETQGILILRLNLHLTSKQGRSLFEGEVYWRKYCS